MLNLQQVEVPTKPLDEFELQIDYQFKMPPSSSANTIDFVETHEAHNKKQYGIGLRPYLVLNLKLIKLSDQEVKVRAVNNLDRAILNKKVKADSQKQQNNENYNKKFNFISSLNTGFIHKFCGTSY